MFKLDTIRNHTDFIFTCSHNRIQFDLLNHTKKNTKVANKDLVIEYKKDKRSRLA